MVAGKIVEASIDLGLSGVNVVIPGTLIGGATGTRKESCAVGTIPLLDWGKLNPDQTAFFTSEALLF